MFQKPVYVLQLYKLKSNNNLRRDQNYDYARVLSSFKKWGLFILGAASRNMRHVYMCVCVCKIAVVYDAFSS